LNVIAVPELFLIGKTASSTYYRYFEVFFIICIIYLIMTLTVSRLLSLLERKLDGPSDYELVTDFLDDNGIGSYKQS